MSDNNSKSLDSDDQLSNTVIGILETRIQPNTDEPFTYDDCRNLFTDLSEVTDTRILSHQGNQLAQSFEDFAQNSFLSLYAFVSEHLGLKDLKAFFKDKTILDIGGGGGTEYPPTFGLIAKLLGANEVVSLDLNHPGELKNSKFNWINDYVTYIHGNIMAAVFGDLPLLYSSAPNTNKKFDIVFCSRVTGADSTAHPELRDALDKYYSYMKEKVGDSVKAFEPLLRQKVQNILEEGGYFITDETSDSSHHKSVYQLVNGEMIAIDYIPEKLKKLYNNI